MKRTPAVVVLLAASLLLLCFFQARGRGLGFAPPLSEWETHPAWWHFHFLADIGEYLVAFPAVFFVALPAAKLLGTSAGLVWASVGLVIAFESALLFFAFYILCRALKKEPNLESSVVATPTTRLMLNKPGTGP